jgi:large subunit ribosomal protein L22
MKYSTKYDETKMARAMGVSLPISTKKSVELCSFIRGKDLGKVIRLVQGVIDQKIAVPFRKYAKGGTGHRPGSVGPGRYPINVCKDVMELLLQVKANAKNKGLDPNNLTVISVLANKGAMAWHYGRQRRRRMKRTHIEIVVAESEKKANPKNAENIAKEQSQPKTTAKSETK